MVSSDENSSTGTFFIFPLKYGKSYDAFANRLGSRPTLKEAEDWLREKEKSQEQEPPKWALWEWIVYLTYPLLAISFYWLSQKWMDERYSRRKNE